MVIQRWQNLLLLIALVLMCIFCCTPYAESAAEEGITNPMFVYEAPVLLIINLVIAIMLIIGIFAFKNLKRQIMITNISIVLMVASMVTSCFIIYAGEPQAALIWTGGVLLLIAACICALAATRFMRKDRNLLRSYDRLR